MTRRRGFTLIELMVALAIFAVVSVVSFSGIMLMIDNRDRVTAHAERLADIQTALTLLQRDLQQAAARPIRDLLGDPRAAMLAEDLADLEFTRAGHSNPLGIRRSELQRVAYRVEDGELQRLSWGVLDQQPEPPRRDRVLLERIETIELRFMDDDTQWLEIWPPAGTETATAILPRAVEITLTLEDLDTITRVVALPEAPANMRQPMTEMMQ